VTKSRSSEGLTLRDTAISTSTVGKIRPVSLLLWLLASTGCGSYCTFDKVQSVNSPDGKWQAVVFGRNCGPTTGNEVHVNVGRPSTNPSLGRGNTFRADADYGKAPTNARGTPLAHATWTAQNVLTITYDSREKVYKKDERVGEVSVRYVARDMSQ
jgi:hypothetical protein